MKGFLSAKFNKLFMNSPIPSNVMFSSIQNNAKWKMIQQAVEKCVNFINNNEELRAVFWYTCGIDNDASLAIVALGSDVTIDKAKLNYYIIDVYPTEDDIVNPNTQIVMEYQELKLKLDQFYNI